jgi:hypothetical protein
MVKNEIHESTVFWSELTYILVTSTDVSETLSASFLRIEERVNKLPKPMAVG